MPFFLWGTGRRRGVIRIRKSSQKYTSNSDQNESESFKSDFLYRIYFISISVLLYKLIIIILKIIYTPDRVERLNPF